MVANIKTNPARGRRFLRRLWAQRAFFLMLLPGVLYYVIYRYVPIAAGVVVSLKKYNVRRGVWGSKWVSPLFANFEFFFSSPYFWPLLRNTLIISMTKMLLGLPLAVMLAVLLNECRSRAARRLVQTLTYMPHFLSWVVIYGMCFVLFSETNGLINDWMRAMTGHTVPFFSNAKTFRALIIGSDLWKSTGWSAIIYLAAISGIDPSLYEAAYMDGATRAQTIRYITLPCIAGVIVMTLILRCGSVLDAGFDQIYVMYNEGVYEVAEQLGYQNYRSFSSAFERQYHVSPKKYRG